MIIIILLFILIIYLYCIGYLFHSPCIIDMLSSYIITPSFLTPVYHLLWHLLHPFTHFYIYYTCWPYYIVHYVHYPLLYHSFPLLHYHYMLCLLLQVDWTYQRTKDKGKRLLNKLGISDSKTLCLGPDGVYPYPKASKCLFMVTIYIVYCSRYGICCICFRESEGRGNIFELCCRKRNDNYLK